MPPRRTPVSKGPHAPRRKTEIDPGAHRWIIDGHNVIFAVPQWESLQIEGRRAEARGALEEMLESLGRAWGVQIWLVFDGNHLERNPHQGVWPHLRAEYSNPPEEADDRILYLAGQALRAGERPLVVTSDRRTLVGRLPRGATSMGAGAFIAWSRQFLRPPEKWVTEGLTDIERFFLSRSPFEEDRRRAEGEGEGGHGEGHPSGEP